MKGLHNHTQDDSVCGLAPGESPTSGVDYLAAGTQQANVAVEELLVVLVSIKKREDTCERMLRECCLGSLTALQVCHVASIMTIDGIVTCFKAD